MSLDILIDKINQFGSTKPINKGELVTKFCSESGPKGKMDEFHFLYDGTLGKIEKKLLQELSEEYFLNIDHLKESAPNAPKSSNLYAKKEIKEAIETVWQIYKEKSIRKYEDSNATIKKMENFGEVIKPQINILESINNTDLGEEIKKFYSYVLNFAELKYANQNTYQNFFREKIDMSIIKKALYLKIEKLILTNNPGSVKEIKNGINTYLNMIKKEGEISFIKDSMVWIYTNFKILRESKTYNQNNSLELSIEPFKGLIEEFSKQTPEKITKKMPMEFPHIFDAYFFVDNYVKSHKK